ncbi:MAG TPA: LemA family protein [Candidatus Pacearchaeota archaeon]|nr:LemA family protein [Candidatus Parcubacteria bacterium]HNP79475.1 LemA family protein [Candidatus Pacearchaeota archaeon]HOC53544.1 LemA family protein [Candidatus Pacearchaeota archaeon]HQM24461.1 LemA family protein [Candidatus Pacearchaeota archaeon]
MDFLTIIFGFIVLAILWVVVAYNSLVVLKNRVKEAWSDIDVQLKRRYDLIPNLVETVKGYASHEQQTFEKVIQARNMAMNAKGVKEKGEAENALAGTLKTIFALAESYPDLKASVNFLELQKELSDTENKIQAARRFYNGNVIELNNKIETVPTNIIANMFGFKLAEFFEIGEEEKAVPKVDFNK